MVFRGWWLTDRDVSKLVAVFGDGSVCPAWLGDPRPDVATALGRPEQTQSGYIFSAATSASAASHVEWWFETTAGVWFRSAACWNAPHPIVSTAESVGADVVPASVKAAADRCNDPEKRLRWAVGEGRRLTLRLDLVNKCNLQCIMCHYSQDEVYRRPARALTLQQFQTMFADIAPIVGEVVLSCADEPLMSRFFSEIVTYLRASQPALVIRFSTNAMLMTAPIRKVILEQRVDNVVFSLDGVRSATLEGIRVGARFERVVGHIEALRALRDRQGLRKPEFTLNFVMMARNIHEAPAFVGVAKRLGASLVDFRHVVDCFDAFSLQDEQLQRQPARFNYYRERILESAHVEGVTLCLPPPIPTSESWAPAPDESVVAPSLAEFEAALAAAPRDEATLSVVAASDTAVGPRGLLHETFGHTFCPRPFSEIVIRQQDEVLPCPFHGRALGRLSEKPRLSDHFFGPEFAALRRAMLRPEGDPHCRACPLKRHELTSDQQAA